MRMFDPSAKSVFALAIIMIWTAASCGTLDDDVTATEHHSDALPPPGATTIDTPVGLALDIEDGAAVPLKVRANQLFYLDYIDMRAHVDATTDEGVAGLARAGDFADVDWHGTQLVDQSFLSTPNPDGTWTRRRFYRKAAWMDIPSFFIIMQRDAAGHILGVPVITSTGLEYLRLPGDPFFDRRLRAIQWANDCASTTDCSTAHSFTEEALVELRYASGTSPALRIEPRTTQLQVIWTANVRHPYTIPVEQVANPAWDYGLALDLAVTTPPAADGTYAPGQALDVKFTVKDGSGNPLPMPTFLDYLTGNDPSGVDYWNVNEKTTTYYRRKHKEKQMLVAMMGPMQDTSVIHDTVDLVGQIFASQDGSVTVATPSEQGFFAEAASVPSWLTAIGVAPPDAPIEDTVHFTLPADARAGTYKIVMKARRSYLGQEIPASRVIEIQVGTPQHTQASLDTGPCTSCHSGGSDLARVGHALPANQRDTCTACHAPLPFEPEGPLYVRTHFIHSRTDRLNASPARCSLCHTTQASIQRTSKSACLSCHKSYPADHVQRFGPVVDMYIGGTIDESFQSCTSSCHRTHPYSGL
jgi:hypothetical protein